MNDPITRAYQDLDQSKRDFLATYTPDLSALLNRHVNGTRTPVRCTVGFTPCGAPATGRLVVNGTPACAHHGGTYPLDLIDPRTWSDKP